MTNRSSEESVQKEADELFAHLPKWRRDLLNLQRKLDREFQESKEKPERKRNS